MLEKTGDLIPVRLEAAALPWTKRKALVLNFLHRGPVNFDTQVYDSNVGDISPLSAYFNPRRWTVFDLNEKFGSAATPNDPQEFQPIAENHAASPASSPRYSDGQESPADELSPEEDDEDTPTIIDEKTGLRIKCMMPRLLIYPVLKSPNGDFSRRPKTRPPPYSQQSSTAFSVIRPSAAADQDDGERLKRKRKISESVGRNRSNSLSSALLKIANEEDNRRRGGPNGTNNPDKKNIWGSATAPINFQSMPPPSLAFKSSFCFDDSAAPRTPIIEFNHPRRNSSAVDNSSKDAIELLWSSARKAARLDESAMAAGPAFRTHRFPSSGFYVNETLV